MKPIASVCKSSRKGRWRHLMQCCSDRVGHTLTHSAHALIYLLAYSLNILSLTIAISSQDIPAFHHVTTHTFHHAHSLTTPHPTHQIISFPFSSLCLGLGFCHCLLLPALTDDHFAELSHAIATADGFGVVVTQARHWLEKLQSDRSRLLREQEEEGRRQAEARVERTKVLAGLEELMRGTPSVPALRRAIDAADRLGLGAEEEASGCVARARVLLQQMNQQHADVALQKVRDHANRGERANHANHAVEEC